MKTFVVKKEHLDRKWYSIDATGVILGRLATEVASRLRGKRNPMYSPDQDLGDYIVVTNAEKIKVSGDKLLQKQYHRHTGYPGGIKTRTLEKMIAERPVDVIEMAVKGMLPNNPLGREMYRKLKVYAGSDHPHAAQMPEPLTIETKTE